MTAAELADLADLLSTAPSGEKPWRTEVDPAREEELTTRKQRYKALMRDYHDPDIPFRETLACMACMTRLHGEFAVHYIPDRFSAEIKCRACVEEFPAKAHLYTFVREVE